MKPPRRALLDTSVVLDLERLSESQLPDEIVVSAVTLAELAAGPHATDDDLERARRQEQLQRIETLTEALPFDAAAARAYGVVYAATKAASRKPRGARASDLFIASIALAHRLPLVTRNPADFEHLAVVGLRVYAV